MSSEPTLSEVMRRLDDTARQLSEVARQMADDRKHASETYVRKDVYDARMESNSRRLDEVDQELKGIDAFRRQVIAGVMVAVIAALVIGILARAGITGG